jgi:amidase
MTDLGAKAVLVDGNQPANRCYKVGGNFEPVVRVEPTTLVCVSTLDASGNQMTEERSSVEDIDETRLFPVTGPVWITGAEAGDAIGVEIVDIRPWEYGHIWTRPGLGFGKAPSFAVRRVRSERLALRVDGKQVLMPQRPMVGTIAVAPVTRQEARDLGNYGGNLDAIQLCPGSTLWLTAQQRGAGIYLGDVHAAMGDAELSGTGVEVAADVYVRLHVRKDWSPKWPTVTGDKRTWVIGVGKDVEDALERAFSYVVDRLQKHHEMSTSDAYITASAFCEVSICQVVNPHVSVAVSLTGGLDGALASVT